MRYIDSKDIKTGDVIYRIYYQIGSQYFPNQKVLWLVGKKDTEFEDSFDMKRIKGFEEDFGYTDHGDNYLYVGRNSSIKGFDILDPQEAKLATMGL